MDLRPTLTLLLISGLVAQDKTAPKTAAKAAPKAVAASEDPVLEGHSMHGEVFNDGPRQSAYLMHGQGDVHFEITTKVPLTQRFFDQGIGQLHGFWYFEAERTFRQAAKLDPDCAMAYWGMAMANINTEKRAAGFAQEAWKRRSQGTKREQMFIDALAKFYGADNKDKEPKPAADRQRRKTFIAALEEIVYEYPDDIEAKAFLANRLWEDMRKGLEIISKQANQAILDQVFAKSPMHPAHHYRVHLWDYKKTAHRVVDSAARSGQAAPGIAHMWHMGGHTFAKLGRHADAAYQQEASARVDHGYMMRDWVLPDQIFNFAHNNEWLTRSMRHIGRVHDAVALAKNMIEMPRHPKHNTLNKSYGSAPYGRRRLLETLDLFELSDELIELSKTPYLTAAGRAQDRGKLAFVVGRAQLAKGNRTAVEAQLAVLSGLLDEVRRDRAKAVDEAEEKALTEKANTTKLKEARTAAMNKPDRDLKAIRKQKAGLEALVLFADGKHKEALKQLKRRVIPNAHLARMHFETGDEKKGLSLAKKEADSNKGIAYPLANYADLLERAGKKDEAAKVFAKLRKISARFDLDMPVFERLRPLAKRLSFDQDWRVPYAIAKDIGERPDLGTLGPLHWTPTTAPQWTLETGQGKNISLADYHGKPVIVIFFLGFGCVHCVEQLGEFQPYADKFKEAGISIVAIGTDSLGQLRDSQENDNAETAYAFPILSDAKLEVFKQWRCHDDFESLALHGTFLVDSDGLIRWQDISYEPFMKPEFLLKESQRLLALPTHGAGGAK